MLLSKSRIMINTQYCLLCFDVTSLAKHIYLSLMILTQDQLVEHVIQVNHQAFGDQRIQVTLHPFRPLWRK
jgi:hypothetical protein